MEKFEFDVEFDILKLIDSEEYEELQEGFLRAFFSGETLEEIIESTLELNDEQELYFIAFAQLEKNFKVHRKVCEAAISCLEEDIEEAVYFHQTYHMKKLLAMLQNVDKYE